MKEHTNALLSPRLIRLAERIIVDDSEAVHDFWHEVSETGTPLFEPDPGNSHSCLVTFLWRGTDTTKEVAVIQDWGADQIKEHLMAALPGTGVWYKTLRMPSDTRTTYQLCPVDPALDEFSGKYQTDPLNNCNFVVYPADLDDPEDQSIIFSMLELSHEPSPWLEPRDDIMLGAVQRHMIEFASGEQRRVWAYTPHDYSDESPPYPWLLLFDGRMYLEAMPTLTILNNLIAEKCIPPMIAILLDNPDRRELTCQETFADLLTSEIIPWLHKHYRLTTDPDKTIIGGSSSGGLGAAYIALKHPEIFGNVLSQTGWYRWKPSTEKENGKENEFMWLARQYVHTPLLPLRFYLDVGVLEVARMADTGPNQLTANRYMRDVLQAKGYTVLYAEYSGGHDFLGIQATLPNGLIWLANPS